MSWIVLISDQVTVPQSTPVMYSPSISLMSKGLLSYCQAVLDPHSFRPVFEWMNELNRHSEYPLDTKNCTEYCPSRVICCELSLILFPASNPNCITVVPQMCHLSPIYTPQPRLFMWPGTLSLTKGRISAFDSNLIWSQLDSTSDISVLFLLSECCALSMWLFHNMLMSVCIIIICLCLCSLA